MKKDKMEQYVKAYKWRKLRRVICWFSGHDWVSSNAYYDGNQFFQQYCFRCGKIEKRI